MHVYEGRGNASQNRLSTGKGIPQEVIMTTAICNTTAETAIAPNRPSDSIRLTELVWGADRRLLERLEPLTRRQSVTLDH